MIIWSHEQEITTVQSGSTISFSISVLIEGVDPITMQPVSDPVTDLKYEKATDSTEVLPDNISIIENGTSVDISGVVEAPASFISIAYSKDGKNVFVDSIDDIPKGSKPTELVPSSVQYKYFKWRIYSESNEDVDRLFTLIVIVTWNDAKDTIIRIVGEIE